jgi:hypothetical protein
VKFTHKTPKMRPTQINSLHVHVTLDKGGKPYFTASQPSSKPNNGKSRFEIGIVIGRVHIIGKRLPYSAGIFLPARRGQNYADVDIQAWFRE